MKKSLTFLLYFLATFTFLTAQDSYQSAEISTLKPPVKATIKGKIVDAETNESLGFSTITLFAQKDSTVVTGSITDMDGNFLMETTPGRYFAKAEYIAYQSKFIENIELKKGKLNLDLGKIKLAGDAKTLAQVEVRAEKSQMTMSLDKRVFNVGKDLASAGGTAEDILDNVPSVTVDVEGNVSLRGTGGVRILVNGKPSSLISAENPNGLRQIQASMIDRIEVITNPSARYEAEGMAGIINIVLKKNQAKGLNGSFDVNVGYPEDFGLGINLNYRKNKFNWFTNIGLRYRNGPGSGSLKQIFYNENPDSVLFTQMKRKHERGGYSGNFKFGADYFFNPKSILTTAFSYQRGDENNSARLIYRDSYGSFDNVSLITNRTDNEFEDEADLEYSLTYRRIFEKKGHEFTADIRYEDRTEMEGSVFEETYFNGENVALNLPVFDQRSDNSEGNERLNVKVDYVQPFSKDSKFEIGMQISFRTIDNDYVVKEVRNGEEFIDPNFTNQFIYDENIHALYSSYGNKINKFSYQIGLRAEYSDVRTELATTNEINDRQYANLFPSAFISYNLKEKNAVQLSYSRRIRRPRFWDLNPFFTLSDRRNTFSGNPNLNPEFTNSYEFQHIKYFEKGSLSSSIYYRHTDDVIQRIQKPVEGFPDRTQTAPENLATQKDMGIEFTYNYSAAKWWRLSGDVNFFYSEVAGSYEFEDKVIDLYGETYSMTGRLTSKTTLWKKIDTQVRINYRAPRTTAQGKYKSITSVDIGANIDILKNNGTLTLSVRDLFNSRRRRGVTQGFNFESENEFQWRERSFVLALNYRLNQKKKRGRPGGGRGNGGGGQY
ncbi:MAG: ferric enterobactin receptor [Saprospiraceae bacterium]|jgi:ferric enterobactin receptor